MTKVKKQLRAGKHQDKRSFSENFGLMVGNIVTTVSEIVYKSTGWLGNFILMVTPFLMLGVGEYVSYDRGYIGFGGEIGLCVVLVALGFGLRQYAKVSGSSNFDLPVPYHRFTDVDENNGQVNVDYDRIQEMILYMADLEDWFERNGYK